MQDSIIYLAPQSCVDPFTNDLNQRTLTVVAAKRNDLAGTPVVDLTEKVARSGGVVVPALVPRSLPMTQGQTIGPYTLYSVSTQIGSVQSLRNSFDVTLGSIKDDFKKTSFMGQSCAPLGGGPTTTTTPPPVSSTTTTSTQPDPTATGWVSLGCYTDSVAARSLPVILGVPDLTNAKCQAACKVAGYTLAGTEYAAECFCGNEILNSGAPAASGCNMPCNGDASEMCGGPDRMNLWEWMGPDEPEPTPTSTSTPPAGPTGPTSVPYPGWSKVGCYTDSTGGRALSGDLTADVTAESGPMDNRKCVEACAIRGYSLAGTEYSGECFCGVVVGNGHGPADDGEVGCNMPCHGASGEYCGGSNRLTMWKKDDGVVEKRKVNLNKEWDHYQRRAMGWNL